MASPSPRHELPPWLIIAIGLLLVVAVVTTDLHVLFDGLARLGGE